MDFDGLPFVVSWELTLACNLRCRHCASSAGVPRDDELSPAEALAICDQFPELLVEEVAFTGGEPLLRPDWSRIATKLAKGGISILVITNGLTLGPDTAAQMKDVGIAAIGVSLDGLEATHDRVRGHKGLFRRVVTGIEHVVQIGLPVTVITTVNALNLHELPAMVGLLPSIGVTRWQIQPIFPLGRSCQAAELQLSERAYVRLGTFVQDWAPKAANAGLRLELADSYGYCTEFDTRQPVWRGCPAGLVTCGITSDGKVKGCLSLPDEFVDGDLRKEHFWDVWFRPGAFAYTRKFSTERMGPNCRSCDRAELCRGGCSAMSYGSTKLFHNDPYCFYRIRNTTPSGVSVV